MFCLTINISRVFVIIDGLLDFVERGNSKATFNVNATLKSICTSIKQASEKDFRGTLGLF